MSPWIRVKICRDTRDPALKAKNPLCVPNPAFATSSARLISDLEYAEIVSVFLSVSFSRSRVLGRRTAALLRHSPSLPSPLPRSGRD